MLYVYGSCIYIVLAVITWRGCLACGLLVGKGRLLGDGIVLLQLLGIARFACSGDSF